MIIAAQAVFFVSAATITSEMSTRMATSITTIGSYPLLGVLATAHGLALSAVVKDSGPYVMCSKNDTHMIFLCPSSSFIGS